MNALTELVTYSLIHLAYLNEEKSPYRNILLRSLIDRLFDISSHKQAVDKFELLGDKDLDNLEYNLFNSNLALTNNEIMSHKSIFKKFKNTLSDFSSNKKIRVI